MKKIHVVLPVLLLLGACASAPVVNKTPEELRAQIMQRQISIAPIKTPIRLSEKTKAQAVGNFVIATVVSSVATSGGGSVDSQMQIGQDLSRNLQNHLPDNMSVAGGQGVDLALAKKWSDYFAKQENANNAEKKARLTIEAKNWTLEYTSFFGSSDYALNYHLQIALLEDAPEGKNALGGFSCIGTAEKKFTLEEWQLENYRAVDQEALKIVEQCFSQTLQRFGLPKES